MSLLNKIVSRNHQRPGVTDQHLILPKVLRYLLESAAFFLVVIDGMVLWAEHTGQRSGMAFRVDVAVQRIREFPGAIRHRDPRCTYAEVWSSSPPVDRVLAIKAMRRTFKVEKQDGPFESVQTPLGTYWIPTRDIDSLAEEIVEKEMDVYGGTASGARGGDVVLDCGANIGVYTRHALRRGAKLVVAIEPAPESIVCLRRNLEKEIAGGRVVVYPKGVWNKDDELQLSMNPELWESTASSVVLDRGRLGPKVRLTTIDKLVAELKLSTVDFVKMDIEGAEMEALSGASETVRRFRPRMAIALEHRPTDPDQIPQTVRTLWPDYVSECSGCRNINGRVQPDVLLAHSR